MGISIDVELCKGCAACADACPFDAITIINDKAVLNDDLCINCKMCIRECQNKSITLT